MKRVKEWLTGYSQEAAGGLTVQLMAGGGVTAVSGLVGAFITRGHWYSVVVGLGIGAVVGVIAGTTFVIRASRRRQAVLVSAPPALSSGPAPSFSVPVVDRYLPALEADELPSTEVPARVQSPDEIARFLKTLPPLNRETVANDVYRGKWVTWRGVVRTIAPRGSYLAVVVWTSDDGIAQLAFADFERSVVEPLREGDVVSFRGQIARATEDGTTLVHVQILPALEESTAPPMLLVDSTTASHSDNVMTATHWLQLGAQFEAVRDTVYAMWERRVGAATRETTWRVYPKAGLRSADGHDERFCAVASVAAGYLCAGGVIPTIAGDPTAEWLNTVQTRTRSDSDMSMSGVSDGMRTEGGVIESLSARSATTCVMLAGDVAPKMVRSAKTTLASGQRRPRIVITYTDDGDPMSPREKTFRIHNRGDADAHDLSISAITTGGRTLTPQKIPFLPTDGLPVEVMCSLQFHDDANRSRSHERFAEALADALKSMLDSMWGDPDSLKYIKDGGTTQQLNAHYRDYDGQIYRNAFVARYIYAQKRFKEVEMLWGFAIDPTLGDRG